MNFTQIIQKKKKSLSADGETTDTRSELRTPKLRGMESSDHSGNGSQMLTGRSTRVFEDNPTT